MNRRSLSRRQFLARSAGAGGGLVIGFFLPGLTRRVLAQEGAPAASAVDPNAYLRIAPDDTVTILLKHCEMGQGVATSLPLAVAEELECDWKKVRFEHAPAAPVYAHTVFGAQMTGGSTSTWESFDQLRTVGATARTMLIAAAAARWNVPASECRAADGFVVHGASGANEARRARFGELADAASKLAPPEAPPTLKAPSEWKLLGKPTHRLDSPAKVTGQAEFGIDVKRPGMLVAVVARSPWFGGTLKKLDAAGAKKIAGVVDVVPLPSGVGIVAEHFWAAKLGRDALVTEWDPGAMGGQSTATQLDEYRARLRTLGAVAKTQGDAEAALARAPKKLEAEYELPYLAHATMEPMNATADVGADSCEVWAGTQFQTADHAAAARIAGLPPEKVKLHTTFLGGGFGRRANPSSDFVSEAVQLSKATRRPVKVIWTREDDTRGGWYRPLWLSRLRAGVDAGGKPVAWTHTIVGQSILEGTPFTVMIKNGIDESSVEGAADSPYLSAIPDHRVDLHTTKSPVPVLWWRSVGHSHTAFVIESFVDELAHAAGKDPVAFRRELLPPNSRVRRALDAAAEGFGWGKKLAAGRGAGIAVHESFGSAVAHAAEVSLEHGRIRVHRVFAAVDCGPVVNPDGVESQLQGGVAFGLSAALFGEITLKDGRVQQSNFHDYPLLRMAEMPRVDVKIVESREKMGGLGEPGVPPIAPAVGNALFALTGRRLRRLPFLPGQLS